MDESANAFSRSANPRMTGPTGNGNRRAPSNARPKRIGFVFGTRPEAIKLAPVIAACRDLPGLEPKVCVTAQHRALLDQVLGLFDIEPDEDLDLMRPGQTLSAFAARSLESVGAWLETMDLDCVLVQGDTTSAF